MENYQTLYLIGSSHIAKESVEEIKTAFKTIQPSIMAVELDRQRAYSLLSDKKGKVSFYDIKRIGFKGFVFALIGGWMSKKLGKLVGVSPGSEMKMALKMAKSENIKVALIDQPIEITLKKFSKALSWKEKWNFIVDLFNGIILRKKDPMLNFDLSKVPEKKLVEMMIKKVKERYPNIHKVLIEERNYYMARKLKKIMTENPEKKIVAVVGAGHVNGILSILKENEGITYSFSAG